MDKENIEILDKDLELAQSICSAISDVTQRNRAVANVVAAEIASEYFNKDIYDVDTDTGLHNVPSIIKDFEISDIYINGSYIDVRIYFSKEEMSIPVSHINTGIIPKLYMFINITSDIKHASVAGFLRPENINKSLTNGDVYFINEDMLESFYNIENLLNSNISYNQTDVSKIYEFLDGSLSSIEKVEFYKELINSKELRSKLIHAVKADSVFNFISKLDEISDNNEDNIENDVEFNELVLDNDDISEYSTEVTPSGADVINSLDNFESNDITEDINDVFDNINSVEIDNSQEETNINQEDTASEEQIDALFTGEQEGIPVSKKKRSGSALIIITLIAVLAAGGFWYYNSMSSKDGASADENLNLQQETAPIENQDSIDTQEQAASGTDTQPMPDETVGTEDNMENIQEQQVIPNIENSLNASVLVSNLKVDWEVPEGYVSNTSAKRYLVKLGKVVQLNLKSELLLLSKPPLVNRITVELSYNPQKEKFEVVGIKDSSGEKSVDALILQTVRSAVALNLSINSGIFSKLQGNPVLVIHL